MHTGVRQSSYVSNESIETENRMKLIIARLFAQTNVQTAKWYHEQSNNNVKCEKLK